MSLAYSLWTPNLKLAYLKSDNESGWMCANILRWGEKLPQQKFLLFPYKYIFLVNIKKYKWEASATALSIKLGCKLSLLISVTLGMTEFDKCMLANVFDRLVKRDNTLIDYRFYISIKQHLQGIDAASVFSTIIRCVISYKFFVLYTMYSILKLSNTAFNFNVQRR